MLLSHSPTHYPSQDCVLSLSQADCLSLSLPVSVSFTASSLSLHSVHPFLCFRWYLLRVRVCTVTCCFRFVNRPPCPPRSLPLSVFQLLSAVFPDRWVPKSTSVSVSLYFFCFFAFFGAWWWSFMHAYSYHVCVSFNICLGSDVL